ncbi:MAG: ferrous iron transporter B [Phycisphaeraceae bacterium]|nr:ferrous iron transporter B [Phycisphaeraceae bacterium]
MTPTPSAADPAPPHGSAPGGETHPPTKRGSTSAGWRIALLGNPNTGKTTLFNRLCGLRAKTANFPGSTVERHSGAWRGTNSTHELIDLPGTYSLSLELPESRICAECIEGRIGDCVPDAAILVIDATNLARNLQFVQAALRRHLPMVVALNLVDVAQRRGLSIDASELSRRLGCPVVPISARSGHGLDQLLHTVEREASEGWSEAKFAARSAQLPANPEASNAVAEWATETAVASAVGGPAAHHERESIHERADLLLTHPLLGIGAFAVVMVALFTAIFWVATFPMDGIDWLIASLGEAVSTVLPEGAFRDLIIDGVIAGVGIALVFLPQICLLFFLISLLEDSGYLARAAIAVDRVMSRFGLPGQAFVPLLSSHACALPGVLSTRLIPDRRDRLAAIFVAPFMSCSARLPVYTLVVSILFIDRPVAAALAFVGCYALGALAGLFTALLVRSTLLRGRSRPMVIELPDYRWPSLRTAAITMWERGRLFLRNAGSVILAISIVMWWLSAYPIADEGAEVADLRAQASAAEERGATEEAAELSDDADRLQGRVQQAGSFAGRLGSLFEPLFSPLGFDRQLTVGVLTSFLAREVFTSTMSVLAEGPQGDDDELGAIAAVRSMTRDDGAPVFTAATSWSVLVFFVLAMQCLPTMVLVKRESGSWGWMALQFIWMSGLAWMAAWIAYHVAIMAGASA